MFSRKKLQLGQESPLEPKETPGPLWGIISPATPIILPLKTFASVPQIAEVKEKAMQQNKATKPKSSSSSKRRIRGAQSRLMVKPGCKKNLRKYFEDYAAATEVHGMRYLAEPRSLCEKVFWTLVNLLSVAGCIIMILYTLKAIESNPVIMGFPNKEIPVHTVPFPAVTICPECKSLMQLFNYSAVVEKYTRHENLTDEEFAYLQVYHVVCDHYFIKSFGKNETFTEEFYTIIDKLSPPLTDWMSDCYFRGKEWNCSELFTPVIVDEGVCYTFNMVDREHLFKKNVIRRNNFYRATDVSASIGNSWSGYDYKADAGLHTYPHRAQEGARLGLEVRLLQWFTQHDFLCKSGLTGFRVLLHMPQELPRLAKFGFRVPLNSRVTTTLFAEKITTKRKVRNYEPRKRMCYLGEEYPLKHFKTYSHTSCVWECVSNMTRKKCGCVPFYMPADKDDKICGSAKYECQKRVQSNWKEEAMHDLDKQQYPILCDCLPLCTELHYKWEYSSVKWTFKQNQKPSKYRLSTPEDILKTANISSLRIFFKNEPLFILERDELYSLEDLVSNFGGLVNFFLGLSILSTIELIYYLTLRIYCNIRLYQSWAGPDDI